MLSHLDWQERAKTHARHCWLYWLSPRTTLSWWNPTCLINDLNTMQTLHQASVMFTLMHLPRCLLIGDESSSSLSPLSVEVEQMELWLHAKAAPGTVNRWERSLLQHCKYCSIGAQVDWIINRCRVFDRYTLEAISSATWPARAYLSKESNAGEVIDFP